MWKIFGAMAFVIGCVGAVPCAGQPTPPALAGAWAGEEQYWAKNIEGDIPSYLALFDDTFTGWPCGSPRPQTKSDLKAQGARLLAPTSATIKVALEDKAASGSGDFVVVYYRARGERRTAGGGVEPFIRNLTHTWVRRPGGWRIIGGMCREDVRSE